MATVMRPMSSSATGKGIRGVQGDAAKPDTWSSLLDSVASGKRLPEKRIILLGGSSATQRDFMDILDPKSLRNSQERQRQRPPIANNFALGYTYQEVLDADQEDILARLSIYTLQDSSPGFSSLLEPLITTATIPETLLVIMLDWAEPWNWITQVRDWVRLLHATLSALGDGSKQVMQELMQDWEQQRKGSAYDMGLSTTPQEANVTIPLGSGEWDEALGLPLCVVCHNADQIDVFEREHGWREDDFDYILQFIRTILLKHGASLVYTSNSMANYAPLLIQYSLGIRSSLKREPLKHNVVDRDKILIPPNWDSWGKIKVLREGFDIEGISNQWSQEIQPATVNTSDETTNGANVISSKLVKTWEESIKNPGAMASVLPSDPSTDALETRTIPMQEFLTKQTETIERLKAEEEAAAAKGTGKASMDDVTDVTTIDESSRVKEHVGPIQFNMGGINLDAEDMLNHIRERGNNARSTSPEKSTDNALLPSTPESGKQQQQKDPEALASFFASLIKKSGGSAAGTPPRVPKGN